MFRGGGPGLLQHSDLLPGLPCLPALHVPLGLIHFVSVAGATA